MSNDSRLGERFAAREFARLGPDSEDAAILALDLEQAVGQQIFDALKAAAEAIVRELNAKGHALRLDEQQTDDPLLPIGISFRDQSTDANGAPRCKLRLAFDLTVSAGYAHLSDELEEARELTLLRRLQ
ncbi:MAG TPA: hypothetical protein VGM44_04270 [Polyangiaceae bacterium]|jgi:hypothetical protein